MRVFSVESVKQFNSVYFKSTISDKKKFDYSDKRALAGDTFERLDSITNAPKIKLNDINIICREDTKNPEIYINLNYRKDIFKNNEAVDFLDKIIINQKVNKYLEDNNLIKKEFYIYNYSRGLDLGCKNNNLKAELKNIKDSFLYPKISDNELAEAKNIAKEIYVLGAKTQNFPKDMTDIDFTLPYNDFCNLIDNVSINDILKYNNHVLQNSEINLTTYVSKKYYNEHKDYINEINAIFNQ